jgi:hypothetical protein
MGDSLKLKNPYVGPVPFKIEDAELFFGRDREATLLLSLVIAERVVLFYAESGAGKSSLINAHLIPNLLKKGYQVLPVVRVGGELPSQLTYDYVYNAYAFNTLSLLLGVKSAPADLAAKTLLSLHKEKLLNIDYEKPHWLIFDQFEEIVTTHIVHRQKRADFFDQLRELLEVDRMLSVVLVMREDHLAEVDDYAPRLPGRLSTRLRMERLKKEAALDAARLPAEKNEEGHRRTFPVAVARMLVEDLSQLRVADQEKPIQGDHVEPMQLQIVCYALWERLNEAAERGEETSSITEEHLKAYAKVDEALETFYDAAVDGVVAKMPKIREADIRKWFGDTLITPSRVRAQVNRGYLSSGDLPNKVVDLLYETYLIRVVEARGGKWYELSHDRFINPILQSNIKWASEGKSPLADAAQKWVSNKNDESCLYRGALLREAQKEYLPHFDRLSKLEKEFLAASLTAESKRSRTLYATLGVTIIFFLLAAGFAGYAYYKNRKYEEEALKASNEERRRKEEERKLESALRVNWQLIEAADADSKGFNASEIRDILEHADKIQQSDALPSPEPSPTTSPSPQGTPTPEAQTFVTRNSLVGEVRWTRDENGGLKFVDNWDAENIVPVAIPQLRNVPGANNGTIYFYRGAAAQLQAAWAEIEAAGLLDRVKIWNGSYARKIIGKSRLSIHTLGLAFDINYDFNRTGQTPPAAGEDGSVEELVPIFERHGFTWSGNNRIPNGSHFEVARIMQAAPAVAR